MPRGIRVLAQQPWPQMGWQYQEILVEYGGSWSDALCREGEQGWKLVSVIHDEDPKVKDTQVRLLMERPLDKKWPSGRGRGRPPGRGTSTVAPPIEIEGDDE